jgi:hypothetical protein
MAFQFGQVKYTGTIGDLTYRRTKYGFIVGEKSMLTAERVQTDPKFKGTRESNADFKTAAQAAQLVFSIPKLFDERVQDASAYLRLVAISRRVLKTDQVNPRGQKAISDGQLTLFEGFEGNSSAPLEVVFPEVLTSTINRLTGEVEVAVPAFVPYTKFAVPGDATHYRLYAIGAETDFAARTKQAASAFSGYLPVGAQAATAPLTLTCTLQPNSTLPLFLGFGVNFYRLDAGTYHLANKGQDSSFKWLKVDA